MKHNVELRLMEDAMATLVPQSMGTSLHWNSDITGAFDLVLSHQAVKVLCKFMLKFISVSGPNRKQYLVHFLTLNPNSCHDAKLIYTVSFILFYYIFLIINVVY